MSMNLRLKLYYETGKPSRMTKCKLDIDLIQVPTSTSYKIVGSDNRSVLEPIYSRYAQYVLNVLGEESARDHLEPIAILIDEYKSKYRNFRIEWSVS